MAYNLVLTNGQNLVTVADGTTDSNYTSLTLVGKNFADYGTFINENYIKLLENFANNSEPPHALQGQIWWDTSNKVLKVRNGSAWKSVSSSTSSTTAPVTPVVGDLWWDTANGQLKVYGGTTWVVVGPAYTATQGQTGGAADIVAETGGGASHVIFKFYVNNVVVAVMSKDPSFTTTGLGAGFSVINPGMTLSTIGGLGYYGPADNALKLGGVVATNYLRGDQSSTTAFPLAVQNNGGGTATTDALRVGVANDFTVGVSPTAVNLSSTVLSKDLNLYVNIGGVTTKLLSLSGSTSGTSVGATVAADPTVNLGIATKQYVDGSLSGTSSTVLRRDGTNTIQGNIVPDANSLHNFGSLSTKFNTVFATSFNGVATDSLALGGVAAANFVRNDLTPGPINGNLSVLGVLSVGSASDFKIDSSPATNVNLNGTALGKGIKLNITNGGGILTTAFNINGADGKATVVADPTALLGIATKQYVDNIASTIINLNAVTGNINPATNNLQNIGSPSTKWNTITATTFAGNASTANYADLAERFSSDQPYIPGTVVELGGINEITAASMDLSEDVFGVISTQAAYLMNAGAGPNDSHPPVAMQGRVPVRVIGTVQKGDRLVSAGNGLARAALRSEITPFNVIGRALASKTTTGEGNVEAIVKLNS